METTRPEIWIFRPAKRRTGSPSEKMIVSKCRETSPPRDSGFSFWREGVLAHFRKDDYFQVLEKQPGGVGFFSRRKGVLVHFQTRGIFQSAGKKNLKIWVLSARHFEPKFPRLFVFPGRRVLGANPAATTYGIHCEMRLSSRSMPYATVQLAISAFFRGRHFSLFSVLFATCGLQYIL